MPPANCIRPKNCMDAYLHGCFYACDNLKLSLKEARKAQAAKEWDDLFDSPWIALFAFFLIVAVLGAFFAVAQAQGWLPEHPHG